MNATERNNAGAHLSNAPSSPSTSKISYNLAMTDQAMVLCPRLAEGHEIMNDHGDVVGFAALNGTILGGTLLVKSEAEFQAVSNVKENLDLILKAIGMPNSTS